MTDPVDQLGQAPNQRPLPVWGTALANAARAAGPPLLFGLRLWASVCLALYVAFWLQLENPYWAGTTAALVCQPHLGASLRSGWFRMIGTIVGGAAIVVMTKCFPQDRAGFLVGLASWGAARALGATVFRNALGIAAAIAGLAIGRHAPGRGSRSARLGGEVFALAESVDAARQKREAVAGDASKMIGMASLVRGGLAAGVEALVGMG